MYEKLETHISGGFDPRVQAIKAAARARRLVPVEVQELVERRETRGVRPAYLDRVIGQDALTSVNEGMPESAEPLAETE